MFHPILTSKFTIIKRAIRALFCNAFIRECVLQVLNHFKLAFVVKNHVPLKTVFAKMVIKLTHKYMFIVLVIMNNGKLK